jgi:hypothetical protein
MTLTVLFWVTFRATAELIIPRLCKVQPCRQSKVCRKAVAVYFVTKVGTMQLFREHCDGSLNTDNEIVTELTVCGWDNLRDLTGVCSSNLLVDVKVYVYSAHNFIHYLWQHLQFLTAQSLIIHGTASYPGVSSLSTLLKFFPFYEWVLSPSLWFCECQEEESVPFYPSCNGFMTLNHANPN